LGREKEAAGQEVATPDGTTIGQTQVP
jgi:hypothetical protein